MVIGIIEDDRLLNQALNKMLTDKGYDTTCAHSREEALALSADRIDLFLIDIGLPDGDGLKLYRELKAEKDVPAIFLTARDEEQDMLAAFDTGADDYVVKPFSIPIFLKKVESLLRRCGKLQGEELIYGHLRIDVNGYAVFWDLAPVELTLTEFELLKTLVQHHGQILTRSQLLDQVWGFDYIGEERIVDAHIKNLRRKLPENIINTVKGIGYYIS